MKTQKIIYWILTIIFSVMMLFSGIMYVSQTPEILENFKKSGYPLEFMLFLGLAKIIGSILLVYPFKCKTIKEWAYSGFGFTLIGAIWEHLYKHESFFINPLIFLVVLIISYILWHKINKSVK